MPGLKIEDIPVIRRDPIVQEAVNALLKLGVGQSFVIPTEHLGAVMTAARRITGKSFAQQLTENGHRIGRVK